MPLSKDLREFVESFNANKVDYLVVGVFALAFTASPGTLPILTCSSVRLRKMPSAFSPPWPILAFPLRELRLPIF